MRICMTMTMTEALLKLAAWLSPGFPVGAFAYSHGLEQAVAAGEVVDAADAQGWIAACVEHGAGRNDAILLAAVMRGEDADALDALARAFASSAERLRETVAQGTAFAETVAAAWGAGGVAVGKPRAYPVAIGVAARAHGLPARDTVALALSAFAANLVSAAIRLVPLGQVEGQRIQAALHPLVARVAAEALETSTDDLGGCAWGADIAAMRHETQTVRLFRT